MHELGFHTNETGRKLATLDEIFDFIDEYTLSVTVWPMASMGSFEDWWFKHWTDLGNTVKVPRWEIAYKFPPEQRQLSATSFGRLAVPVS